MIKLCTDPNCDEEAGLTIQRQIDPAPVPYCHPHGAQRQHELQQALENFRVVVIPPAAPPTDLELAMARISELEEKTNPDAGNGPELADQLETALHTLEAQSKTLDRAREQLGEKDQALQVLRRELERTRAELVTTRAELVAKAAAVVPGPITPPPPTRPDHVK
jgi:ABC-type transporter Mla subunit MlaD